MTEAQKCLYHIAENMRMAKSISKEGYEYFQQAIKALEQQPCEDCVSREQLNKLYNEYRPSLATRVCEFGERLKELPPVKPATVWHKIKTRPLTEEEKDEMYLDDNYYTLMYDCKMPNYEQKVLVKTQWGIDITTYYKDDGCYFEGYEDEGDVIAWMPLPEWKE